MDVKFKIAWEGTRCGGSRILLGHRQDEEAWLREPSGGSTGSVGSVAISVGRWQGVKRVGRVTRSAPAGEQSGRWHV